MSAGESYVLCPVRTHLKISGGIVASVTLGRKSAMIAMRLVRLFQLLASTADLDDGGEKAGESRSRFAR